jgi:dTDP-4-amino-4,6-dideoxygalactose transaminase
LTLLEMLRPGDVVITTPFTFVATVAAAVHAGATVRFVDIGEDFNLDPSQLEAIDDDRIKAVIPVHLYGQPCDMRRIGSIAASKGWAIVEDAAQAVGAKFAGSPVGSFGVGCFSLYATKNVTAGEGGVITTDDDGLAAILRTSLNQGMERPYEYAAVGTNRRLTDLQAAIALPQLDDLSFLIETRRGNAAQLRAGLMDVEGLDLPVENSGSLHVYHQFTVRLTGGIPRQEFRERLTKAGIATGVYYPKVVFDYECFRNHPLIEAAAVPRAQEAARQVVSLPVHPGLRPQDLERIVTAVRAALDD